MSISEGVNGTAEGMSTTSLDVLPGFWRLPNSADVRKCHTEEICVGGFRADELCLVGYDGPYCGTCAKGYAATGSDSSADLKCFECKRLSTTSKYLYLGVACAVIFAAVLYCCFRSSNGGVSVKSVKEDWKRLEPVKRRILSVIEELKKIRIPLKIILA